MSKFDLWLDRHFRTIALEMKNCAFLRSNMLYSLKIPVLVRNSCVCLTILFSHSVWSHQANVVITRLKELKTERLNVLKIALETVEHPSSMPYIGEEIRKIPTELYAAMREDAGTSDDRLRICQIEVQHAERQFENARGRNKGRLRELTQELMCQANLLQAEITLENFRRDVDARRPRIKELQGERLEVLHKAYAAMKKDFNNPIIDLEVVRDVATTYFAARRERAETQQERIKLLEEEVRESQIVLEVLSTKHANLPLPRSDDLRYKMYQSITELTLDSARDSLQIGSSGIEAQANRLDALKELYATLMKDYTNPRYDFETFRGASAEFFAVCHQYAKTREERIKVCQSEVQEAEKLLEFKKERAAKALATKLEVLQCKVYLLDAQIRLENATTGK